MEDHIRTDILDVLSHAQEAIQHEDVRALRELSNMTIHNASIHQDTYSILTAVLIYALSKIHERPQYARYKGWGALCKDCGAWIEEAQHALEDHNDAQFEEILRRTFAMMNRRDSGLRKHVQDVLAKAKITKASRIYEHGISLGRTADLLGITQYELMDYVGRTYIADVKENMTFTAKKRLQTARGIFP